MAAPTYLPEAIATAIGWAHPITGEQLDVTKGLAAPVAYYKPNAKNQSFLDPAGATAALLHFVKKGDKKVIFQIHAKKAIKSVSVDYGDGTPAETTGASFIHAFDVTGTETFTVTATITYADDTTGTVTADVEYIAGVPAAPANTAVPTITGSAVVGQVLTAVDGTWTGNPAPTFTYAWFRGTTAISGATSKTYTLVAADAGSTVKVRVTGTNSEGTANAESAPTASVTQAPANTAVPTVTGTARVGQTLTAAPGTWTGTPTPTYTYQWQRGTTNISGATSSTYVLVAADAGQTVRVVVTGTNSAGNASANSANTASVTQTPANTAVPTITGTAQEGQVLTSTNGTWTGTPTPTYTRQWKAGGVDIAGATAQTYTPVAGDVGKTITVAVTGTNSAGNATATSAATAAVVAAA
ncbi:whisker protein [Stenotrophomonas phage Marzo]|nr:whisker protein [Stenotrophomonas phage Marzo]